MLDTNTCIYIARRRPPEVETRFARIARGELVISAITHGELAFGAAKSKRALNDQESLAAVLRVAPVLPIDEEVSAAYGKLRADLQAKRTTIGNNDIWIGAHALSLGLILVTNNEGEFRRIEGLAIENWVRSRPVC
jgi:tRNA(fMet)-specific endonuclease VapC